MTNDSVPKVPADRAKTETILVSEKIIADISTGIYRTPAAALKELVANAYDAEATSVTITTDAPRFRSLVIRDDGNGMDLEKFLQVITHIGGSWKRLDNPDGVTPRLKRPIIGRIGIGLLAVAQLGQRFYVSSTKRGSHSRFLAEIDLTPFHKDDAALRTIGGGLATLDKDEKVEIGVVKYIDGLPERRDSHFTVITVANPKQGLVSELHGQLRAAIGADADLLVAKPAANFKALARAVLDGKRADAVLDSYHYLLWELGLLCPVPYFEGGIFRNDRKRPVENSEQLSLPVIADFHVTVDKYRIARPIEFPNPCAIDYGGPMPIVYPLEHDKTIAGRRLRFSGYVYSQQPRIDPVELQGLQIRIRNVGIGGFDRTWMGYPFDEGMKFGQVSGELFIHDGLESALNIDRASFRETDPHYLAVRAWMWDFLRRTVFPDFKARQDTFRHQRKVEEKDQLDRRLSEALLNAPEGVGVRPKAKDKRSSKSKDRDRPGRDLEKPSTRVGPRHQGLVIVEDGEAIVDQESFSRATKGLGAVQKDRLLRICAVLAAYGLWDRLGAGEAEDLFNALAIAVES